MANILDTLGSLLRPRGSVAQTTVPRSVGSKIPTDELLQLAGNTPRERSTGSRIGTALLGTLIAGALGPEAVQVGGGLAGMYAKDKEQKQRQEAMKKILAADAEQKRQIAEAKQKEADRKAGLESDKNTREWIKSGESIAGKIGGYFFPKPKEYSPSELARADYYKERTTTEKEMRPGKLDQLNNRVKAALGRPSGGGGRSSSGGAKVRPEKPAKQISAVPKFTVDKGQVVPTDPAKVAVAYDSKVAPIVADAKQFLALRGVGPEYLLKRNPATGRKPLDDMVDQVGGNIPPEHRPLVIRAIMANLGMDVPRVQEPMEPDFKDEGILSMMRDIGAAPADAIESMSKWGADPSRSLRLPNTRETR